MSGMPSGIRIYGRRTDMTIRTGMIRFVERTPFSPKKMNKIEIADTKSIDIIMPNLGRTRVAQKDATHIRPILNHSLYFRLT